MKPRFCPYLLANYPDSSRFQDVLELTQQYADVIEVGIPFSDPVADGPVIAAAASEVLTNGFEIESVFASLSKKRTHAEIAIMSYANPILAYGRQEFVSAAAQCGARYLIVPDVPFEEAQEWKGITREHNMAWVSFVSLITGENRLKRIATEAEGFVYLISVTGITGSSIHSPAQIRDKAIQIRNYTSVPIALGFGIKGTDDVARYRDVIEAFIVGSRLVQLIGSDQQSGSDWSGLRKFYESFRSFR